MKMGNEKIAKLQKGKRWTNLKRGEGDRATGKGETGIGSPKGKKGKGDKGKNAS